jgi:hypothetical protein
MRQQYSDKRFTDLVRCSYHEGNKVVRIGSSPSVTLHSNKLASNMIPDSSMYVAQEVG